MNKTIILSLGLVLAATPLALADSTSGTTPSEARADCENNVHWTDSSGRDHVSDQDWAGYSDDPLTTTVHGQYDAVHNAGVPVTFRNCEGEQWDGQDSVHGENKASVDPNSCLPDASGASAGTVTYCYGADPNYGGADVLAFGHPIALRVSEKVDASGSAQLYVMTGISPVGHTGVYQGVCKGGATGLEGSSSCDGSNVQDRTAWYGNDDTPNAVLASIVTLTITKGYASAGDDCTQAQYTAANAAGAPKDANNPCHRDNTAVTAELLA